MKNSVNLVFVVLFFVVLGCSCPRLQELVDNASTEPESTPAASNTANDTTTSAPDSATPATTGKVDLTLEKYNQIKDGMTYKEVVAILGSEGTETMSSAAGPYKIKSYKWEGDKFQFIIVNFTNDKVNFKTQANLK